MTQSLEATETECAAGRTAPRVSLDDIKANIAAQYTFTGSQAIAGCPDHPSLAVLTICLLVLRNGFTIIGKSAPADARNFDADLGAKLAYEDAVRQVWPLMGYALREQLMRDAKPVNLDATEQPGPYSDLAPHMQRVALERDELRNRLDKLVAFINGDIFAGLSDDERFDLVDQQAAMCAYLARLDIRLSR